MTLLLPFDDGDRRPAGTYCVRGAALRGHAARRRVSRHPFVRRLECEPQGCGPRGAADRAASGGADHPGRPRIAPSPTARLPALVGLLQLLLDLAAAPPGGGRRDFIGLADPSDPAVAVQARRAADD